MSAVTRNQVFSAVHTIGGLLPADLLVRISEGKDVSGSLPKDYQVVGKRSVRDEAERHWDYLKGAWADLRAQLSDPRDQLSGPREQLSDPREQSSDPGERQSDSRERQSDSRQQLSGPRDQLSDPRDQLSDPRERQSDVREQRPVVPGADVPTDPTGLAIKDWLLPLFSELGFGALTPLGAAGLTADDGGKTFAISHRWTHVPVHLIPWHVELDRRPGGAGAVPAQSLVQECLNRTESHLWGVVSNGRQLRLLRDSSALATAAYVEFDLEAIFDGELFSEFVLLYRLLHVSRFAVAEGAAPSSCRLEKWRTEAITAGTRALEQLRDGVRDAITTLGTGFLRHPDNAALREAVDVRALHAALLRLVYRLLFVFVAEDRNALHDQDADAQARDRYAKYFSTARLRAHALRRRGTSHSDLYQGLRIVLDALGDERGRPELGLPGLGGIFDATPADKPLNGLSLANEYLLQAVRHLARVRDAGSGRWRAIDYRHLDAEELGSIYESLLELIPRHSATEREFELVTAAANARKTTGSYYTPSSLIECLLDSALDPVIDDAVKRGSDRWAAQERQNVGRAARPEAGRVEISDTESESIAHELLSLTVCDPACGSGHFLVAAARRIAKRVAAVREGNPEPTLIAVQSALHEVIARCIYGVDLNPMAVELAKVSLWLEALKPGKPLSFLDAHIKCGNSLIGATPKLLRDGIPDAAFTPIEGDDKKFAKILQRKNERERAGQLGMFDLDNEVKVSNTTFAADLRRITSAPAGDLAEVRQQEAAYRDFAASEEYVRARHVADAWCAAFFWHKTPDAPPAVTEEIFRNLQDPEADAASHRTHAEITRLAIDHHFFHWHLEFPEVFTVPGLDSDSGWAGGFSCMLGNPPWDTLSPDEKEFFATYNPDVRAMKKEARQEAIAELLEHPGIKERWTVSRRGLYALAHFIKDGGRYRLFAPGNLGKGDFNLYRMFVESALGLTAPGGSAAQVTPSGIYNGANAQAIRAELFDNWNLQVILGFVNVREEWFSGAHPMMQFAIYSALRSGTTKGFSVGFQIENSTSLDSALARPVRLSVDMVRSQSPSTLAISDTVGGADVDVANHIYKQWPMFAAPSPDFPRGTYQREIDMGTDRDRYTDGELGLPLYEGRMVAQYDHRAKSYVAGRGRSAVWRSLEFGLSDKEIVPQWVVPDSQVPKKAQNRIGRFRIGFCRVVSPRNERTLIAALIPPNSICGDVVPTILYPEDTEWAYLAWLASANSLCLDFLARKKVTLHMDFNVVDSLPFPRIHPGNQVLDRLARLVLRLTCTGPEMVPFWNAMAEFGWTSIVPEGQVPAEALIDSSRRAEAQAKIDALVAKYLFNLERSQLEHIMTTFPTLSRNEHKRYGEYRTRRLVLNAFEEV